MSKSYNVVLVSIGDELCIGQTLNTNVHWLSRELVKLGANVISHLTIKDEKDEIISSIKYFKSKTDLFIFTGGLGPTHDDITKKVLTKYFNDTLEMKDDVLVYLKKYFASRNRPFLDRHYEQAMLPSKSKIFPNTVGTAQGMLFMQDNYELLSMPGVPREMKNICENSFLEYVKSKIIENKNSVMVYRTIRTVGIAESTLADLIGDISFLNGNSLAFLPSYSGVKLRLGTKANSFEEASVILDGLEKYITEKCSDYIYSTKDEDLENQLASLLSEKKLTISAAESCTGGLFGSKITSLPGSSRYFNGSAVTYSNEAKNNILNVSEETLDNFGAVSKECAIEMARGAKEKYNSDLAISITGIAGPEGGTEDKPVGTVWIGVSSKNGTDAHKFIFGKDREINRELSTYNAMNLLINEIKKV